MSGQEPELTPEQLEEAIRGMKISDILLSTVTTLAQLTGAKLDEGTRDLEQARIGIEALKALLGVLEGAISPELMHSLQAVLTQLQLAYAGAAAQPAPGNP
jgi:hypothetical protein